MRSQSRDRISELPFGIRQQILSFLPMKDVARSSVLSSTWRDDWLNGPYLTLGWNERNALGTYYYYEFVNCFLARRRTKIQKLDLFLLERNHPLIEHGLASYIQDNSIIEDIELTVHLKEIPKWMLTSPILTKLCLYDSRLPSTKFNEIKLPALRELTMVASKLDQLMVDRLIASCPAIEMLCISSCSGFKSLEIFGLPKLKVLRQWNNDSFERVSIDAPNIVSLAHDSKLQPCDLVLLTSCQRMTRLLLRHWPTRDDWLSLHKAQLMHLKELEIFDHSNVLRHISVFGTSLQTLSIFGCNRQRYIDITSVDIHLCQKLRGLRLVYCTVTDGWLNHHLTQLGRLQVFRLDCCRMPKCIETLSKFLPTLQIRDGQN